MYYWLLAFQVDNQITSNKNYIYSFYVTNIGLEYRSDWPLHHSQTGTIQGMDSAETTVFPAPPNCPLRDPQYHQIDTIRPLIEVHWGSSLPYVLGLEVMNLHNTRVVFLVNTTRMRNSHAMRFACLAATVSMQHLNIRCIFRMDL